MTPAGPTVEPAPSDDRGRERTLSNATPAASPDDPGSGAPLPDQSTGGPSDPTGAIQSATGAPAARATRGGGATLAFDPQQLDLAVGVFGALGDIRIWVVPAATIGVPGILVLLWVALQAGGAIAWLPAVKRLRGDQRKPARR
jgi:hypothetical protein